MGEQKVCKCGDLAIKRTVTKEGMNKGKEFWGCAKLHGSFCDFFQWVVVVPQDPKRPQLWIAEPETSKREREEEEDEESFQPGTQRSPPVAKKNKKNKHYYEKRIIELLEELVENTIRLK